MDILSVIESFSRKSDDYHLTFTIGKIISRQCFAINNKIFFDVLKTYLQKNSWFISKQYLSKTFFYGDHILESITEQKKSTVLDLDIPVTQCSSLYKKKNETLKKFKGTYFDLFCHGYNTIPIETSEFSSNCEKIYNEVAEQVTIFKRANSNLQIIFSVSIEDSKKDPIYSVKLNISNMNEAEKEEFLEVFEIIELAMCKYKKTDKTVSSTFQQS